MTDLSDIKDIWAEKPLSDDVLSLIKDSETVGILVIDVQKEFCDPRGERGLEITDTISKRIRSIIPAFKKANIKVYSVYFSFRDQKRHEIDFFRYRPDHRDTLIRKDADSAFKGSNIDEVLKKDGKRTLLVCGFNLRACVQRTVNSAKAAGYEVIVMNDLTGNDRRNGGLHPSEDELTYDQIRLMNMYVEKSQKILDYFRKTNPPRNAR